MNTQNKNNTLSTQNTSTLPHQPSVLVFDSGVGGLSVYQEIKKLVPQAHYLYAFDNAGFPYGEKDETVIIERVLAIVQTIDQQHPLDLVVIACNTASTIVLPTLRAHFKFPIVGVVPAIKPATLLSRNGVIGLLATRATVNRPYTHKLINEYVDVQTIKLIGTARLVEIAEEKLHGISVNLNELKEILQPWLNLDNPPDTVVLGCTHFPLLRDELRQVLPSNTVLVDTGEAVAKRVLNLISIIPILNQQDESSIQRQKINIAICTQLNEMANKLRPILVNQGFFDLIEVVI